MAECHIQNTKNVKYALKNAICILAAKHAGTPLQSAGGATIQKEMSHIFE